MFTCQPLKTIAAVNTETISDTTDPDWRFHYIDIGAVGRGELVSDPVEMSFGTAPSRARRVIRAGDTIVSSVRTYLRAVLPVDEQLDGMVASTGFVVARPFAVEPRFLAWALQSDVFVEEVVARSTGVSYPAINPGELASVDVPVPSRSMQRRIADYLDAEVARISELIALKQESTRLVGVRCDSEIEALVLGLREPGGSADDTFLGHVPYGWGRTVLRHLRCTVQTGPFGSQLHAEDYVEGGWPVVNPANLRSGGIVAIPAMCISDEKRAELSRHVLRLGDIVFGRRGEMGRAGLVTEREVGWLCGTGSLRLRLDDPRMKPDYLKSLLSTSACRRYFTLNSVGSTMDNLNSDIVLGCPVLVPPVGIQDAVIEQVRSVTAAHADTVAVLTAQIALLQERRRSLITAVVTGEMEVP